MERPREEIIRLASRKKRPDDPAPDGDPATMAEVQQSWSRTFSRKLSQFVRMGTVTAEQKPSLKEELLAKAKSVTIEESGDYRVRLCGPQGEIPLNMWDLSKYPFWPYDHYQTLRKEWLQVKARRAQPAPEDAFTLPHPGVDYQYSMCPYLMHIGTSALASMRAHCILPDGCRLPADVDRSVKIPAFTDADYTLTCGWFSDGSVTAKETSCC